MKKKYIWYGEHEQKDETEKKKKKINCREEYYSGDTWIHVFTDGSNKRENGCWGLVLNLKYGAKEKTQIFK